MPTSTDKVAESLLEQAHSDPAAALERLSAALADPNTPLEGSSRAVALRAGGLAARSLGDLVQSRIYLEDSAAAAQAAGDETRHVEARLSLAGNEFLAGDWKAAMTVLEALEADDEVLRARIEFQAGTILARVGQTEPALRKLNNALAAVRKSDDRRMTAVVSKNRGMLRMMVGNFRGAESDLERARDLFDALGIEMEVAYCTHNLALLNAHSGDLPRSLALFDESEVLLSSLGVAHWSKAPHCYALLSAGLAAEAAQLAEKAVEELTLARHQVDRAEALSIKAAADATLGRTRGAIEASRESAELFRGQDRPGFAAEAELTSLELTGGDDAASRAETKVCSNRRKISSDPTSVSLASA